MTRRFSVGFSSALLVLALVVVWGIFAPGDARAQHDSSASATSSSQSIPPRNASASEATVENKAALVIDASGSMADADVDGGTRMDAAKQASRDLVNSLPETANLGLLAYGMRESSAPDNRERGCRDIETLVPVGELDKQAMITKIDEMTPSGYTPIGNALRAAAKELGNEGERTIILVSDGIDTCAPPPVCEVAKELANEGIDLTIHTVGFKTDEEARKELECIADAAGGIFMEADDAGSLADSLKFLAQRDASLYKTAGTEFEYSDTPENAKWLGEGRYRTTVTAKVRENPKDAVEQRYFKIAIPKNHNAIISTAVIPKRSTSGWARDVDVEVGRTELINANESCGGVAGGVWSGDGGRSRGNADNTPEAYVRRIEPVREERGCEPHWTVADEIFLTYGASELTYGPQGSGEEAVDVEVVINFEPIPDEAEVADFAAPEQPMDSEDQLDFNGAQEIHGGSSFANAVEVEPGAYKDAIVPGEYRFYKIPVEYGQRPVINYRTGVAERETGESLNANLYSPFRATLDTDLALFATSYTAEGAVAGDTVNFRNREDGSTGKQIANAGYYYVGLAMDQGEGEELMGVEQPFEIAFAVDGQTTNGPEWRPTDEDGPEPSDTPPSTRSSEEPEATESETTQAESEESDTPETGDGGSGSRGMLTAAIGIGIVVLLAAIAVAVAVLRRR
mgnify:CR=1 FL=1